MVISDQLAICTPVGNNLLVSDPENVNQKEQPKLSKPDGGLKDGSAAMAVLVLVIVLIVLGVRFL